MWGRDIKHGIKGTIDGTGVPLLSSYHHISNVCQHDYPIRRRMYKMQPARAVAGWIRCTHGNVQKVLQIMAKVVEAPRHCRSSTPWYRASLEALFWLANHHQSSQVFVHVRIVLVALQVVPCDEILNPLLDGFEVRLQHYTIPVRKWQKKNTNRYLVIYQNTTRRDPTFHSHDQVNN